MSFRHPHRQSRDLTLDELGPVIVASPTSEELPSLLAELTSSVTPVAVVPVWAGEPGRSQLDGLAIAVTELQAPRPPKTKTRRRSPRRRPRCRRRVHR